MKHVIKETFVEFVHVIDISLDQLCFVTHFKGKDPVMDSNGFQSTVDHLVHFPSDTLRHMFDVLPWRGVSKNLHGFFSKHVEIFFLVMHPPGGSLRTVQSGMNWSGSLKMHMKPEQVIEWVRYTAIKPMVQTSYINLWPGWKRSSTCMERSSKNFHQGAMSVVWRASLLRLAATWPSPWAWCSANEISSCASKLPMILIYFNTYINLILCVATVDCHAQMSWVLNMLVASCNPHVLTNILCNVFCEYHYRMWSNDMRVNSGLREVSNGYDIYIYP